jgi:hypothetical protein
MNCLKRVWKRVASERVFGAAAALVVAAVFAWSTAGFLRNKLRYARVTSWPSVPATIHSLVGFEK